MSFKNIIENRERKFVISVYIFDENQKLEHFSELVKSYLSNEAEYDQKQCISIFTMTYFTAFDVTDMRQFWRQFLGFVNDLEGIQVSKLKIP